MLSQHVVKINIARELKIDHKKVLNNLHKASVFKKKLDVWVSNMMNRIHICEALTKRNVIDPFFKRMVSEDEKWVKCENIVKQVKRLPKQI